MNTRISKRRGNAVIADSPAAPRKNPASIRREAQKRENHINRINSPAHQGSPALVAPLAAVPGSSVDTRTLKPVWTQKLPIDDPLYFYLRATEDYGADGRVVVRGHGEMLMLGSYSYLGLNRHPQINKATHDAIDKYGTGGGGARLLSGTLDLHQKLEARLAEFKHTEAAVTFVNGYSANLGTIACLVGRHDAVICDKLDHASIVDGCLLSGAKFVRFRHNDMEHLKTCLANCADSRRKLVVVDAVFSMNGDIVNLPEVVSICRDHGAWLMVDEAHSIGVLGCTGHGIEEHFGLPWDSVDIKMGTLSKAIPSMGGYVAGTRELCQYLSHESKAFIYSGALSPPSAAAALAALDVIEEEPERVLRLQQNTAYFAGQMRRAKLDFLNSATPIFPIICGDDYRAVRMAKHCQDRGIYVQAIPYPVVPKGSARLRASVMAVHRAADLDYCVAVIREAADRYPVDRDGRQDLRRTKTHRTVSINVPSGDHQFAFGEHSLGATNGYQQPFGATCDSQAV